MKHLSDLYAKALEDYEKELIKRKELEKQLEAGKEQYNDLVEEKEKLQEQLSSNILQLEKLNKDKKIQQKEFIDYMNKTIEELECDDVDDEEMKVYLIQRIDTFKEILQKYKSIIGVSDENNKR